MQLYELPLNTAEMFILESVWQKKTYSQMALEENYSPGYFTNVVAPKLFKKISELVERRFTKKNCRSLLTKYVVENGRQTSSVICKRNNI